MVQVSYNAQHNIPWHWPVPAYLVTKGIGAGLFILLGLGWLLDWFAFDSMTALVAGFLSLLFVGLTTGLLVYDLEKPERFLYILLRPQWSSWLTRGAVFLIGFSTVTALWWLFELGGYLYDYTYRPVQVIYLVLGIALALGTAVYTAFLFAQAEGRDLWQSPLLPFHLVVQAFMMGGAAIAVMDLFMAIPADIASAAKIAFVTALIVDLFITLVGEFTIPHASEVAATAAHEITHGRYKNHFWIGSVTIGHLFPLALLLVSSSLAIAPVTMATAGIAAVIGLYLYEYAFVMAPQEIPNS
jgi:formate-dependent nitrite reductase membrane component NrfD